MTIIQDTITYADGSLANGRLVVSWQPFTVSGVSVASGQLEWEIVAGVINLSLYGNVAALPNGAYYVAKFELENGAISTEYWMVPDKYKVTLGQIRVSFPASPSAMISPLQLGPAGAQPGQFLMWDGQRWVPGNPTLDNFAGALNNITGIGIGAPAQPQSGAGIYIENHLNEGRTEAILGVNYDPNVSMGVSFYNDIGDRLTLRMAGSGQHGPGGQQATLSVNGGYGFVIATSGALDNSTPAVPRIYVGGPGTAGWVPDGSVGIGTISPSQHLTISYSRDTAYSPGDARTWSDVLSENRSTAVGAATGIGFSITTFPYTGNVDVVAGIAAVRTSTAADSDTALAFITRPPGAPSAERMRITSAGLVGIGRIPTTYSLEVAGDLNVTGSYRVNGAPFVSGVTSIFGRTGVVVAAAGDYNVTQVTNAVDVTGLYVNPAFITSLAVSKVAGAVPDTRQLVAGTGLTGGGNLTADRRFDGVPMGASGAGHAIGMVPDPGVTPGATRYLREDATWGIPAGAGGGLTDPTTTKGDLIVRGSGTTRLAVGTDGQMLLADSTQTLGVRWATRVLTAGTGLTGGGDLSADRAFAVVNDTTTQRQRFSLGGSLVATRQELNFAAGANVSLTVVDNSAGNRVDVSVAAVAGLGLQSPWLGNIDGNTFTLTNVNRIAIGATSAAAPLWIHVSAGMNISAGYDPTRTVPYIGAINDAGNANQPLAFQAASFAFYSYTGNGFVGIGLAGGTSPLNPLHIHVGVNQNLGVRTYAGRTSIGTFNDAGSAPVALGFDATVFDFAGGNVGIGIATPWAQEVISSPSGVYPPVSLTSQTPAIWECGITAGPGLAMFNGGSPRYGMVLQTRHQTASNNPWELLINPLGGNVGIGPAPYTYGGAAALLDVGSNTQGGVNVLSLKCGIAATGDGPVILFGQNTGSAVQAQIQAYYDTSTAGLGFKFITWNGANLAERVRITGPGFVGIGGVPICKLSLGSDVTARKLAVYDNGATYYGFGLDATAIRYEAGASGGHSFYVNGGTQALTILSSGNVGIGATNPVAPFHVKVGTDQNFTVRSLSGIVQLEAVNDARSADVPLRIDASQYQLMSGNVGIGTTQAAAKLTVATTTTGGYNAGSAATWATTLVQNLTNTAGCAVGIGFTVTSSYPGNDSVAAGMAAVLISSAVDTQLDLAFITRPSGNASAERMRITAAGLVGIGRIPTTYPLEVAGDVNCTGVFRVNGVALGGGGSGLALYGVCTSATAVTNAAYTDIPGCSLTLSQAGRWLITASFDANINGSDGTAVLQGVLNVAGTVQNQVCNFRVNSGNVMISNLFQQWVQVVGAGTVVKLQAWRAGGTATTTTVGVQTTISAVWVAAS